VIVQNSLQKMRAKILEFGYRLNDMDLNQRQFYLIKL
jgi:hypothetical protein